MSVVHDSNPKLCKRPVTTTVKLSTPKEENTASVDFFSFLSCAARMVGAEDDAATQRYVEAPVQLDPTLTWSESLLAKAQARPHPYELVDFLGTWRVLDDHYRFRSFEVIASNQIVDVQDLYQQDHHGNGRFPHDARVVGKIVVTTDNVDFRNGVRDDFVVPLPHELYVLVLHENGVVKFVPVTPAHRELLAQLEGYNSSDVTMNLSHADEFGGFCFGIVVGEGRDRRLMRLNRWATDNRYFWQAVNITRDFPQDIENPRQLISEGLAKHGGIDGSTPAGALRDTIVALASDDGDVRNECGTVAVSVAMDTSCGDTEDCLRVDQFEVIHSHALGLALIERVAKQTVDAFPQGASLREHPDLIAVFRQLNVPADMLQRILYDTSVAKVSAFVHAIKSNIVKMPVLVRAAEELEKQCPGRELPTDNCAAEDVRRALLYCYALHTLGLSFLHTTYPSEDLLIELFEAQKAAIDDASRRADMPTATSFELLKHDAVHGVMPTLVDGRRCSISHDGQKMARELRSALSVNIVLAAVEDVGKGNFDNARAGYELALWGCWLRQKAQVPAQTQQKYLDSCVALEASPTMTSEWVQTYILWNLCFGYTENRPFLPHAATLLVPCLLTMTNADPSLFLWMRALLLNAHTCMLAVHPEMKQVVYDWRSANTSEVLGVLTKRLALQLSMLIEQNLGSSARDFHNVLGTSFSAAQHRVLEQYRDHQDDKFRESGLLGEGWLGAIRNRVVSELEEFGDELEEEKHEKNPEKGRTLSDSTPVDADFARRVLGKKVKENAVSAVSSPVSSQGRTPKSWHSSEPRTPHAGLNLAGQASSPMSKSTFLPLLSPSSAKRPGMARSPSELARSPRNPEQAEAVVRQLQRAYSLTVIMDTLEESLNAPEVDPHAAVSELGLSSRDAIQVQEKLVHALPGSDVQLGVLMDPGRSLVDLADELVKTARGEGETTLAPVAALPDGDLGSTALPQRAVDVLQAGGVLVVVFLVSLALIPPYHFGLWAQWRTKSIGSSRRIFVRRDNAPWSHIKVANGVYAYGLLLPLVIPNFMTSLTVVTIGVKWITIGRYRAGTTQRGSWLFLRWWLVDRVVDQFNAWVGVFIYDTLLINVFHTLMGANVAMSASIETLIREFDLVFVGEHATVSGAVYPRMFAPGGAMYFARVTLERGSSVKSSAVVMPGCCIEAGAVLDHLAASIPGMRLSNDCVYQSSPAALVDENASNGAGRTASLLFEILKLAMLMLYLYSSFVTTNVIWAYCMDEIDWDTWFFRYRELAYSVDCSVPSLVIATG